MPSPGRAPTPARRVSGKLLWFLRSIGAASEASRNPVGLPDFKSYREQPRSRLVLAHFQRPAAVPSVRYVAVDWKPLRAVGDSDGDRRLRAVAPLELLTAPARA